MDTIVFLKQNSYRNEAPNFKAHFIFPISNGIFPCLYNEVKKNTEQSYRKLYKYTHTHAHVYIYR